MGIHKQDPTTTTTPGVFISSYSKAIMLDLFARGGGMLQTKPGGGTRINEIALIKEVHFPEALNNFVGCQNVTFLHSVLP